MRPVPTAKRSYIGIDARCFSKYVGDELLKFYDCYIAKFSKYHKHLDKFHHQFDVPNCDNETVSAVVSVDVGNVYVDHTHLL